MFDAIFHSECNCCSHNESRSADKLRSRRELLPASDSRLRLRVSSQRHRLCAEVVSQQSPDLPVDSAEKALHVCTCHNRKHIENQLNSISYFQSVQKYQINPSFIITDNPMYKHRAILLQPKQNLSGEWMCSVSTYHTRDRQIKAMKIIGKWNLKSQFKVILIIFSVPEKSFELYQHDMSFISEASDFFIVICTVTRITPEPELSLKYVDTTIKFTRSE